MHSPHSLMLPETTQSLHQTYTLFRGHEGGMVEMGCQDEMVEMDSQGEMEKKETLVCRDYLAHKVYKLSICITMYIYRNFLTVQLRIYISTRGQLLLVHDFCCHECENISVLTLLTTLHTNTHTHTHTHTHTRTPRPLCWWCGVHQVGEDHMF